MAISKRLANTGNKDTRNHNARRTLLAEKKLRISRDGSLRLKSKNKLTHVIRIAEDGTLSCPSATFKAVCKALDEDAYVGLVELLDDGCLVVDEEGPYRTEEPMNEAATKLAGFTVRGPAVYVPFHLLKEALSEELFREALKRLGLGDG